uniref:Uncharacterized protein n=1 Tax=Rhizoctonia solani TaxID=456999 RepID=N0A350_9AGAM|nr:hypothetical protein RSOL_m00420 [Rhizoctonia solani]AGK45376.1 hypothetical protein RSOL_m00420 [Rhizoctonia solani]
MANLRFASPSAHVSCLLSRQRKQSRCLIEASWLSTSTPLEWTNARGGLIKKIRADDGGMPLLKNLFLIPSLSI